MKRLCACLLISLFISSPVVLAIGAKNAQYVGGRVAELAKAEGRLEYLPARSIGVAIMVSPLALFSRKRKHYQTISGFALHKRR